MVNNRFSLISFQYSNHIKAAGNIDNSSFKKISTGYSSDLDNLLPSNCLFWIAILKVLSVLDLNKNKSFIILCNNIDFTLMESKIPLYYSKALFGQKFAGKFLPFFSSLT